MADVLQRPEGAAIYNSMASTWPRGDLVYIRLKNCDEEFRLPIAFVRGSGNNTLRFVQELAQYLVNEPGHISNLEQLGQTLDDAPANETRVLLSPNEDGTSFTWAKGPDGRYSQRAPGFDDPFHDSASLASSQVSSPQVSQPAGPWLILN